MNATNRKRNVPFQFYVSSQEAQRIRQQMHRAGYASFSAYARDMLQFGHVNHVDFSALRLLNRELGNLNRNLNQIAHAAHTLGDFHETDYQDVLADWCRAKNLIDRYFYRIIRTKGEAYKPPGERS